LSEPVIPVILSGGAGTRLWPLSRELYPKQLLPLLNEHTMLQNTVQRLEGFAGLQPAVVVCNDSHRFMVAEQLRAIDRPAAAIVLEPCGRNTAPAVAVAAHIAMQGGDDPLLLVLPADHALKDITSFQETLNKGVEAAMRGALVTFGIVAGYPETGYGYIKAAEMEDGFLPVAAFVEKPDLETARAYVASGNYYWNSGMFLFRASVFLEELACHDEVMADCCKLVAEKTVKDLDFIRLDEALFSACPANSIDYAVMEKTEKGVVLPLDAGWDDVGSWSSLWDVSAQDEQGNVEQGDVIAVDTEDSYIYAETGLVATVGVKDHIIVQTADAVLVVHKERVQDVKEVVAVLKRQQRPEALLHRRVNRPWGTYECIDSADRFLVKRICVNPGASLSLQMHHHRAEHWIVVKGTALVVCGEKELMLSENQSTYIPVGTTHRLENPGKIVLELIEVQSGSYLGEDDIVRFEDNYGRG